MATRKSGPNSPCPCGSGKKFKYCHGRIEQRGPIGVILIVAGLLIGGLLLMLTLRPGTKSESGAPAPVRTTYYDTIPGVELASLDTTEREQLVRHLNHTPCPCDCDMTVAECRHRDPTCEHSLRIAQANFQELEAERSPEPISPAHGSAH